MKLSGRSLKRRLYGLKTLPSRVARARYFRGHGVHSPFVYAIVREVFMKRGLAPGDHSLYDRLLAAGVTRRRAEQLQNLFVHCGYGSFAVDALPETCDFCVLTLGISGERLGDLVRRATGRGTTVAVMAPCDGRERREACRALVGAHPCTTVDNRGYLLFFNDENLPKQHFRI